ncbi:MAG: hypothetical protein ACXVEU_05940 [Nocardioidaceae bacterium]
MDLATPVLLGGAAVLLLLLPGVLLTVLLATRRRLERELASSRTDLAALRERLDALTAAPAAPAAPAAQAPAARPAAEREYLITDLPEGPLVLRRTPDPASPARREGSTDVTAGSFVSLALGESLVKAVSFGHGLRRALSPANRNRIAFEIRSEVRRARKARRREEKAARRYLRSTAPGEDAA